MEIEKKTKSLETRKKMSDSHTGKVFTEEHRVHLSDSQKRRRRGLSNKVIKPKVRGKKLYQVTLPNGNNIYIRNLKAYCRQMKLSYSSMKLVVAGEMLNYYKYKCSRIPFDEQLTITELKQDIPRKKYTRKPLEEKDWPKAYIISVPDGTEVKVANLSEYCREHNLNYDAMRKVSYGTQKQHKGYTCIQIVPQKTLNKLEPIKVESSSIDIMQTLKHNLQMIFGSFNH